MLAHVQANSISFKVHQLILLIIFCIASFFLFYGGGDYLTVRSLKELWNLGHIVYFALTIYFLAKLKIVKKLSLLYQWLSLLLFSLLWGVLIEVLQYDTSRTADIYDVMRDITGCLLILSFHPSFLKLSGFMTRFVIRLLVSIILIIQLQPFTVALIDELTSYQQFPVLSNFETFFELGRWGGNADRELVHLQSEADGTQLRIGFKTTTYSGAGLKYLPSDWRGYKTINFRFFNPADKSLNLVFRIHDAQHLKGARAYYYGDRFNQMIVLQSGWNDVSIALSKVEEAPKNRKMDMSQIRDVSFFTVRLKKPAVIYLDKVYLGP